MQFHYWSECPFLLNSIYKQLFLTDLDNLQNIFRFRARGNFCKQIKPAQQFLANDVTNCFELL